MALFPLHGQAPLGLFDIKDTDISSLVGGEVMTFGSGSRTNTLTEKAAADVLDGYDFDATGRVLATFASAVSMPNFLADDGNAGYSTMLGTVVGGGVGAVISGSVLGPNTAIASGKVSLHAAQGLYEVTLSALAPNFVLTIGASGLAPGAVLGHSTTGLLAHSVAAGAVPNSGVANFVEASGSNSLVTTQNRSVGATVVYDRIKIWFNGGLGVRSLA